MRNGFEIARVLGITIRIRWSWFPVVALIAWSLAAGYLPGRLPGATLRLLWLYGLGAAVLLFASVLLHELAHAVVARRAGLPVGGITTSFPVVAGPAGRDGVVGIVTIHQVKTLPAERWRDTTVREVMVPMREDLAVTPGTSCWAALGLLSRNGVGRLLVREGARLVGYLRLRDVLHLLALQAAAGERHGRAVPRAVPPGGPRCVTRFENEPARSCVNNPAA